MFGIWVSFVLKSTIQMPSFHDLIEENRILRKHKSGLRKGHEYTSPRIEPLRVFVMVKSIRVL